MTEPMAGEAALLLRVRGVDLGYDGEPVLHGVSLEIRRGEFWCLLGTNGSGKTSLLRVLLGLMPPLAGRIERHAEVDPRSIGFVPQHCAWNTTLPTTVREFVSLGLVGLSVASGDATARIAEALRTTGIGDLARQDFRQLSGGQRQRAMLARALVRQPRVLVLDEPTASLDPAAERALLEALAAINRDEGVTVLFVTHDLDIASQYASHVALFHDGHVAVGPREEAMQVENLERIFGAPFGERLGTLGGHCA